MKRIIIPFLLAAAAAATADNLPESCRVYPTPKKITLSGGTLPAGTKPQISDKTDASLPPEGYRLTLSANGCEIIHADDAGLFYGQRTLDQLLRKPEQVPLCVIEDSPDIPFRGVVEGFYGRPWGTAGRLKLMKFLGQYKMNTFIYGPKDDPYHHTKWKEPYPETMAADFRKLLAEAKANYVNFYWAIHLGNAFAKPEEREADYKALMAKLEAMYELGFRSFAAFFDDFGGRNADLHAEICNRIRDDFLAKKGDCNHLIVCPNVYTGNGDNEYCKKLGEKAKPDIEIMWTGKNVCCEIDADYAKAITANYRRAPFVWWNWPVNDFLRSKLLMGRTYGVAPYKYAGFVSNPMENLEASKIGLFGVADMTWNGAAFDSTSNWHQGISRLYPYATREMEKFCEHNSDPRKDAGWLAGWTREESEKFASHGDLRRECDEIISAAEQLERLVPEHDPDLWREIEFWVKMFGCQGREGSAALNMLAAKEQPDGAAAKKALADYAAAREMREKIGQAQVAHFQSLAPEWDKKNCIPCRTATKRLQPAIDQAAKTALAVLSPEMLAKYFPIPCKVIGNVEELANRGVHFENGEKLLVLDPVLEQLTLKPRDWFGLSLANGKKVTYVWADFDNDASTACGAIELSKDGGENWIRANIGIKGPLFSGKVDPKKGFNAMRWINISDQPVKLKIVRFNVDI